MESRPTSHVVLARHRPPSPYTRQFLERPGIVYYTLMISPHRSRQHVRSSIQCSSPWQREIDNTSSSPTSIWIHHMESTSTWISQHDTQSSTPYTQPSRLTSASQMRRTCVGLQRVPIEQLRYMATSIHPTLGNGHLRPKFSFMLAKTRPPPQPHLLLSISAGRGRVQRP